MANRLFSSWLIAIFLTLVSASGFRFGFLGGGGTDLACVCSQTSRPSICVALFKSDYRSSTADIRGLTNIAIGLAYNKVIQLNSQSNYGGNPDDTNPDYNPGYNNGYGTDYRYINRCPKYYTKVIEYMESARDFFGKGEYERITSKAKSALKQVQKCRDALGGSGASGELELLLEMVLFSSMRLNRGF